MALAVKTAQEIKVRKNTLLRVLNRRKPRAGRRGEEGGERGAVVGRLREHIGWKTGGSGKNEFGKGGHKVVGGPDGGVGV